MGSDIETLVSAAKEGNKHALEELVLQIQDRIYGLALRMLYDPSDAQDASQEILLKIITHLGTFRGESAFTTWMYRVAANHLLTTRKRRAEREAMSFEAYEEDLDIESARNWQVSQSDILQRLFVEEIRISCLQGLLLCLDREHRLAFLLADVFGVSGEQGAAILDITPAAFRKRLSRARETLGGRTGQGNRASPQANRDNGPQGEQTSHQGSGGRDTIRAWKGHGSQGHGSGPGAHEAGGDDQPESAHRLRYGFRTGR